MSQLPPNLPSTYTPSGASTNTLALVSIVTGVVSVVGHFVVPGLGGGTLALVAIVTGFIARSEIKRSGQQGMWMATLGIIIGLVHFAFLAVIFFVLIAVVFIFGGIALLHH